MSDERKKCPICQQIEGTQDEYFKATVVVMRGYCFADVAPSEEGQRAAAERACVPPNGWRDGCLRMADKLTAVERELDRMRVEASYYGGWEARMEELERERAEARSRTDEYIRLNVALGARVERMEAWIKEQGHKNHACFERVDGQVVRHRSGRCECGYDAALAP